MECLFALSCTWHLAFWGHIPDRVHRFLPASRIDSLRHIGCRFYSLVLAAIVIPRAAAWPGTLLACAQSLSAMHSRATPAHTADGRGHGTAQDPAGRSRPAHDVEITPADRERDRALGSAAGTTGSLCIRASEEFRQRNMTIISTQFDLCHGRIRKPVFFETQRGRNESFFRCTKTTADPGLGTAIIDRLLVKSATCRSMHGRGLKYSLLFGGSAATWHQAPGLWQGGRSW